ncbi:MAG: glycosyltransferase [Eubacteriales bacterium]
MERGEPPVYIGFGSMAAKDPARMAQIVLDAVSRTGRRAVIATGWGGISTFPSSDRVFVLDQAPHDWLFPRMSVIVHHGGAGTTAEALRAGKPNVIVPFIVDQQFWGRRVQALGAGPAPIPARKLTAKRLANAIDRAATDPAMRESAERIRNAILAEHGLDHG